MSDLQEFDYSFASPWQILVLETSMTAQEQAEFTQALVQKGMGRDRDLGTLQTQYEVWRKAPRSPAPSGKAPAPSGKAPAPSGKAPAGAAAAPSDGALGDDFLKEFCRKLGESEVDLNDWTAKFTSDMAKSRYPLSPKQRANLEKLFGELRDKVKM